MIEHYSRQASNNIETIAREQETERLPPLGLLRFQHFVMKSSDKIARFRSVGKCERDL